MDMNRREFEMTAEDLETLLNAGKPIALIMLQCGMPRSAQERANDAWASLGRKMGFEPMSVRPNGKGDRFFTAVPTSPVPEEQSLPEAIGLGVGGRGVAEY